MHQVIEPSRSTKARHLQQEIKELRARLAITDAVDVELWEKMMPQEQRDQMAARALLAEWGDVPRALTRMGFSVFTYRGENGNLKIVDKKELARIAERVLATPGVREIMRRDLKDLEAQREDILARLARIALYGEDDASVKAASQVAKLMGWQTTPDTVIDNRRISLYSIVGGNSPALRGGPAQEIPPDHTGFLDHEPGEPTRIDSGDPVVDAAFAEVDQ